MKFGTQTLEWKIARVFVKWYVRRLVRRSLRFKERNRYNRTIENCARARLNAAKIAYWRNSFRPWGNWNKYGCRQFVFRDGQTEVYRAEIEALGLNEKVDWG